MFTTSIMETVVGSHGVDFDFEKITQATVVLTSTMRSKIQVKVFSSLGIDTQYACMLPNPSRF